MAMKRLQDVVYAEKYTDRDGSEKTRYTNCGVLLQRDDGSMCIKLESLPIGFTGWFNCYEPRNEERAARGGAPQRQAKPQTPAASAADDFNDDDLPF